MCITMSITMCMCVCTYELKAQFCSKLLMCFNKSLSAKLDDLFLVIVNVFITFTNSIFSWNYLKIHSRLCTYSSNSIFWFKIF
jgi:hypothetical protein